MPLFRYEVRDRSGRILRGAMDAGSEAEVRQRLSAHGYIVNLVIPAPGASQHPPSASQAPGVISARIRTSRLSAPAKDLALFFRALASFLTSGMTVGLALERIASQAQNRAIAHICQELISMIQAGAKLSDAMARFPRAFPQHVIGTVAAGELGGFLPIVVGELALDYEIAQRASTRFRRWVIWIGWINAVGTFMLAPAAPIILPMTIEQGSQGLIRGLLTWVKWATTYVALPIAALFGAYFVAKAICNLPSVRPKVDALALRVPGIGPAKRERSVASFTRILGRLLKAGVLPLQAWEAACNAPESPTIAAKLRGQIPLLRSGTGFPQAMAAAGCITMEDQRSLLVGEQTGQLPDALDRLSTYYEDAAKVSAGTAERMAIHFVIIINIIALAVAFYCMHGLTILRLMETIDKVFSS